MSSLFITSCGGGSSKQEANATGFSVIENQIKDKFGKEAYYTDLSITYNESIGNIVSVTVTDNPELLQMAQWNQTQDNWNQTSDVTIEIPEGTKATDFMFQLNEKINLKKLGELVEQSKAQLTKEKSIENPKLHIAAVKYPDTGEVSKAEYVVMLQPENGGTTFSFSYTLAGELTNMDY
ncbi:hypothetical protein H9X57_04470 [Flavobacterium piscinae]|uniref:hypothetical protein n=1 Tax=Flavobacterium piscinae TaxID=2506424 RepID=UPI001989F5E2|nr:hypothetical protein [Flavobacterium piscinae]MBC8882899.1 hypothetical protein [Flavobacterium piscinae]